MEAAKLLHFSRASAIVIAYYYTTMASTKAGGSAKNLNDSNPKYLGVKLADGAAARPGMVIVRQRGTQVHAGANVRRGGDDTLYAAVSGTVKFNKKKAENFTGALRLRTYASIVPKK